MNPKNAIEVCHLSKHFRLPIEKSNNIKQAFVNWTKGIKGYREQTVLKDISFEVEKGDFLGIVGRNGSGKSTLLKLISGIYVPDSGSIEVEGSLVSFIELGVGFNNDLSGRDNVYLNGALMGFTVPEIDAMYDEIVQFAELEDFMDQKLKNYSSGMQVRLAFSCAVRAKSDILVLDEVLAVGDEAFQRKCDNYFTQMREDENKTIILVTHSMNDVRTYCNKAIMIKDGEIIAEGSPEDVANEYSLENFSTDAQQDDEGDQNSALVKNLLVTLLSPAKVSQNDTVVLKVEYQTTEDIETYVALTAMDLDRNVSVKNSNSGTKQSQKGQTTEFIGEFNFSEINDTNIRLLISVRDTAKSIIGYYPEGKSPAFALRRDDYPDIRNKTTLAVLYDRGVWK